MYEINISNKIILLHKFHKCLLSSVVEQLTRNEQVVGSNPMGGSHSHLQAGVAQG